MLDKLRDLVPRKKKSKDFYNPALHDIEKEQKNIRI